MRTIKFRGKSLINGKWFCGDSIKHTENASKNETEVLTYIGCRVENARKVGAMKWIPVNTDTVGQFTGLYDQNNKEIYEGDVVDAYNSLFPSEVIFNDGGNYIYCPFTHEYKQLYRVCGYSEVIGNVHDNPELIKEPYETTVD